MTTTKITPGRGPRLPREVAGGERHDCRMPACRATIPLGWLMCRPHWRHVPRALQARVWATWASGAGWKSPEYREAVRQAVAAVTASEAGQ